MQKVFEGKAVSKKHESTQTEETTTAHLEYMKVQNKRFKTFSRCIISPEKALEFAANGFFYVKENLIQCAYCLKIFDTWKTWKDVSVKHKELVPNCPLVVGDKIRNQIPTYRRLQDVPNYDYCGNYSPEDYVLPTLKGFQLGDDDDESPLRHSCDCPIC